MHLNIFLDSVRDGDIVEDLLLAIPCPYDRARALEVVERESGEGRDRPLSAAASDRVLGAKLHRPTRIEGCGRPFSAPSSDRFVGARLLRPSRREGHGRPMSAAASDRFVGARLPRPSRIEGHGRPISAAASDHLKETMIFRRERCEPGERGEEDDEVFCDRHNSHTDEKYVSEKKDEDVDKSAHELPTPDVRNTTRAEIDGAPSLPAPILISSHRKVVGVKQLQRISGYFDSPGFCE